MANYAIIRTGGKQYRAETGAQLTIEKIEGERGASVTFDDVLLVRTDDAVQIGAPIVEGAVVTATIVEQTRDKKIIIHKHKKRKKYRKTQGHRQWITRVRIEAITA